MSKQSPTRRSSYQNVLSNIVKEGVLSKRKMFGWVKYNFVLRNGDLRRYSTKSYRNVMKAYPINSDCHVNPAGANNLEFTIKHKKHTLHLKAATQLERDEWIKALNSRIVGGSQQFTSQKAREEKEFRKKEENRKRQLSKKRNSVIANLKTFDIREVGSPKPDLEIFSAQNDAAKRGRGKSISIGSNEGGEVRKLSPAIDAPNTPIATSQRS